MSQVCLASVDIGTESARAALLTPQGKVLASASRQYGMACPRPGWAEQDPESWWEATVQNLRDCRAQAPEAEVAAVCVAGQMHATVAIDGEGRLVSHAALLWCDKRSAGFCDRVAAEGAKAGLDLTAFTGNTPLAAWTGFKLRWLKENQPEVYRGAATFLSCSGYLNYRLTGARASDYSEASGSFLFDAGRREWSPELCALLALDQAKLPEIRESAEVIGTVTREAAAATGLTPGTPVVCGGGDMMLILLGAGIASFGQACDVTGTAADVSVFTPRPLANPRLMHLHHVVPGGGWIAFGILDAGGGSLKWFRDTFAAAEVAEARRRGVSPYEVLSSLAEETPPGAEGLFYLPYLLGERTLGSATSRGVFFGLTPRHTTGHCVRAIMEGVTYDLRQTLDLIAAERVAIGEIRAIAGGAKSPLWCQIKADVYRRPVVTLKNFEGGVVGGAILAGLGVGLYGSVAEAAWQVVELDRKFIPDAEEARRYEARHRFFKRLHDGFQEYFGELAGLE
ncbi:MAG: xylulokinase [Methanocella sp.]